MCCPLTLLELLPLDKHDLCMWSNHDVTMLHLIFKNVFILNLMFYNMYFPKYSTLRKLTLTLGGGGVGRVQQKNFSHLDYTHTKKK